VVVSIRRRCVLRVILGKWLATVEAAHARMSSPATAAHADTLLTGQSVSATELNQLSSL
jgi:hypothetical protein